VHTPKHGSWLNMAEPELSVLTRKWTQDRNARQTGIDWQFRTDYARIKLKYLYPKIEE